MLSVVWSNHLCGALRLLTLATVLWLTSPSVPARDSLTRATARTGVIKRRRRTQPVAERAFGRRGSRHGPRRKPNR